MTRQEIMERIAAVVHDSVPELADVELREDTVINSDLRMESMELILIICKLEDECGAHIPNRLWSRFSTLGQVVDAIEQYRT